MIAHPAWSAVVEPEWTPLAPGVSWLLTRPDGLDRTVVAADVATVMSRIYDGRAGLEELGLNPETDTGGALTLTRLSGYASVLTACLYARRCLLGWRGMESPDAAVAFDDPEAIRAALILGPPSGGPPLLTPFLAWVEGPHRPMAADADRLRRLARDHWSGGAERCRACVETAEPCAVGASDGGEICPRLALQPRTPEGQSAWDLAVGTSGLWVRAGMDGRVSGLDFGAALLAFEARGGGTETVGSALRAFQAIERGRLEAEAERAETDRKRP